MANDPVCGQDIHPKTSEWLVDYQGQVFHFCNSVCRDRFVENPSSYVTAQQHISTDQVLSAYVEKSVVHSDEIAVVMI